MENEINNNNKGKEYNYVYFIESHEKDIANLQIYSKKHELKTAHTINIDDNDYLITIYKLKIFCDIIIKNNKNPQKYEFSITIIDNNKNKFKKYVSNLIMNKDNFLFNIKFQSYGFFKSALPPKSLNQTLTEQFNLYLNFLKNELNCTKESDEINDLIFSIQTYIIDNNEEYDFSLYLMIFIECHKLEAIKRQLDLFKVECIKEKGELSNEKIEELDKEFDTYIADFNNTKLKDIKIENKGEREEYKIKLYTIILYFNYKFKNDNLNILNDNKDINKYFYRGLSTFTPLFNETKLKKEQIQEIINASNNFTELKNGLEYCSNVKDLLQIIYDRIDKYNNCYSKAKKDLKKDKKFKLGIEIGQIVKPNINDNLKDISDLIHKIDREIKNDNLEFYLIFDSSFFKKYIKFYHKKDIDNLLIILELIILLKNYCDLNEAQLTINKSLNETGYLLGSQKKLENSQILNCIKNDINYNSNSKYIKDQKCFDIFNSLDFDLIDDKFKKISKTINWINVFGKEYQHYIDNMLARVNHIKYFNCLFLLFNINFKDFNLPNDQRLILIKKLQGKYFDLTKKTYEEESCPNFNSDSANLLYLTDQYGNNVKEFLRKMNEEFPEDRIYNIYMELLTIHNNLSKITENTIVKFILNKKNNDRKSYLVLYLLERCENSKELIITYFEFYLIKEKEILEFKESENIKLVKGLLDNEMLTDENKTLTKYFNYTKEQFDIIKNRIKNDEITYNELEPFFTDKSAQEYFYNRLLIIYLNNKDLTDEANNEIKTKFNKMKNVINDLENLLEDKKIFFTNLQKDNIIKLKEFIDSIKKGNYIFFKQKENEIKEYLAPSKDGIKERTFRRKNSFFLEIYNKKKEKYPNDELKRLEESNNELNKYKPFLIGQKLNDIDIELSNIIKSLNLNKESINKIADELITLFELEEKEYKLKIINSLMSLTYKDKFYKIVTSLMQIIEFAKVKKGAFYNILDIIKPFLEKKGISISIDFSIRLLQNYFIDIFDEEDNLIKLLITLNEFPEIFHFLLEGDLDEKTKQSLINRKTLDAFELMVKFFKVFQEKDKISELEDFQLITKIKQEIESPK